MDSSKAMPQSMQRIRVETPVGTIETMDDNPIFDGLVVVLVFAAFCFYVYAKYFGDRRWK